MESGLATSVDEGRESPSDGWTELQSDALWKRLLRPIPLIFVDLVSLVGILALAEYIIQQSAIIELSSQNDAGHRALSVSFIAISLVLLWALRIGDSFAAAPRLAGFVRTAGVVSFAAMLSWFVWLVLAPNAYNQPFLVLTWTIAVFGLPLSEFLAQKAKKIAMLIKPPKAHLTPVIILGSPSTLPIAEQRFQNHSGGYRLVGTLSIANGNGNGQVTQNLSRMIDLNAYAKSNGGVVVAAPANRYGQIESIFSLYSLTETDKVSVALYPRDEAADAEEWTGWQPRRFSWWYEKFRRGFDVVISLASLIIASPLIILISALIKIDSRGPILFSQARVGRDGRIFNMYKFRSMVVDAENKRNDLVDMNEASGLMFKIADDPRVTRVGRVIRRLSLDEIPQFLNVLQGTMSIVGPRPPLPYEVQEYEPWHFRRFEAAPGITGLWQVKRGKDIDFDEMVRLDIDYIDNWSLKTDLSIILKTLPAMLGGRGAY